MPSGEEVVAALALERIVHPCSSGRPGTRSSFDDSNLRYQPAAPSSAADGPATHSTSNEGDAPAQCPQSHLLHCRARGARAQSLPDRPSCARSEQNVLSLLPQLWRENHIWLAVRLVRGCRSSFWLAWLHRRDC